MTEKMNGHDVTILCDRFLDKWPGSNYGPSHIVTEDYNFSDSNILYCIVETYKYLKEDQNVIKSYAFIPKRSNDELVATLDFLIELAAIPERDRENVDD